MLIDALLPLKHGPDAWDAGTAALWIIRQSLPLGVLLGFIPPSYPRWLWLLIFGSVAFGAAMFVSAVRLQRLAERKLPSIRQLTGEVRPGPLPLQAPTAGIRVSVEGGPCRRVRARLVGIQGQDKPGGFLQWSSFDGGAQECDIDTEAWLDVFTIEHANWATIVYADHKLRSSHRVHHSMGTRESQYIVTIDFGGDNISAVQSKWLLTLGVPHRTVDSDGLETVWITPNWLPPVTFDLIESVPRMSEGRAQR